MVSMMTNANAAAVTVTISARAASLVGWDDPCLTPDLDRQWAGKGVMLTAHPATMRYAADLLSDFGDVEQCGAGFTSAQRAACRRAEAKVRAALAR
jgi:hypothetical protein